MFALPAAASAVAAAAPAAAAAAAKATIMTTLKSVAFNALTNLAISAALSVFSPTVGASARTVEFVIDPDGPISFAAGHVGVPGAMAHKDTFGPDLMYYGIPVILSGAGPITAIQSVKADDYPMAFDANGGATTEPYRQEFFFRSVLGHQPAPAALTTPNGLKNNAKLPGWTTAHKLSGKAAFLMVMAENSKGSAFPNGEVKPLVELLGLKGWDPTLDSTYPGGSGSCRLHDASTWVTLTCPILWGLKWALGLWEGPTLKGAPAHGSTTDHQVGGIGARLSGVDVPAFVAASNIAKANAWTVSAYPNTDDDKHQVLETFLQSGGATYSQRAGKISCISRAAPRASLVTISAADTAGPLEIDTAASQIDRVNTLRPRFWSPAHRWQMTAMDGEVTAQSYRDEDGGRTRPRGVDYPFVSNAKQAGQLAALQIAHTREGIAGVIPLKPHLQRIRPGDAFTITEAGFVLNGLKCLCLNTDYDPATGVVRVSFVSETDAKYPFALGQDPTPPEPQVLTPVDPRHVSPPAPGDWTVTVPGPAPDGSQLPNIDLTGLVSNDTADALLISWRAVASGENPNTQPLYLDPDGNVLPGWMDAGSYAPTIRSLSIQGPKSGAVVWLALRYRRGNNFSAAELKGPITVRTLVADVMPNAPGLSQIKSDVEAAFGDIFDVSGQLAAARSALEATDAALYGNVLVLNEGLAEARADTYALYDNVVALDTGMSGLQEIVSQQTVDLADKASQTDLALQVVRIDDAAAINASQALALVDLENSKVALSEYEVLRGEVLDARNGAPSLLGQIQYLQSVDLDLDARKVELATFSELVARTDGVEAVNADQALALIDLESGKVALSEYNTLKGEVAAARDGAASLLGQIQNLKTVDLDLQNNKASVASVDALTARSAAAEADIIDLENAVATEAGARAEAISQVAARQAINQNLMPNGSGENGPVNWSGPGLQAVNVPALGGTLIKFALAGSYVENYASSPRAKVSGGQTVTLQWKGVVEGAFSGSLQIYIAFLKADGSYAGEGARKAVTDPNPVLTSTAPGDAAFANLSLFINGNAGAGVNILLSRCKIEAGSVATIYSNDATAAAISASVTEQALALIDLESGKVALSEYNTLKGEVAAARDGAASLLGQIQNLKTVDLDLQNNKASVASVDALTARSAAAEADIIDLENAVATEAGARAEAISQVAARQAINQNLMPNGSGENGPVNWSGPGLQAVNVPALGGTLIKFALAGSYVENYASSPRAKVSGGQTVTLQWKGVVEGAFSGSLQIYIAFLKADGSYAGEGARKAVTDPNPVLTSTAPGDAAFANLSLFINGNAGAGVNILLSRCKIEAGSVATIYSNDATAAAISAAVTEQSLAIIDLQNNQAIAAFRRKVEATGGKPTILEMVSGSFGNYIALTAEQLYFGDNTVFDDATDTIQTVWGSTRKVMAWGAPFGPDNLVEWTGPSSIALGSMTKANAGFWVDQTGAYGPTPLPSFWAKVTPTQITRSRTGAGPISTALNDVIVTCYTGTSGATCTWSRVSGDASISYPSTGFTPVFNTTLAAGQTKTALFVGLVAKGGDVDLVYVNVEFSDNV